MGPLWRSAPLVLLRYPGLLVAVALGAFLLALSAAGYPLFLERSGSALVRDEIRDPLITRYDAGLSYVATGVPLETEAPDAPGVPLHQRRDELFAEEASRSPSLAAPISTVLGPVVSVSPSGRPRAERSGRLFAGEGAVEHIEVISGSEGPGAWVPDLIADALDVGPGDTVEVGFGTRSLRVPVDGVYRALYSQPRRGYWLRWDPFIYSTCREGTGRECPPAPPQFLLLERDDLLSISRRLGATDASFAWTAPLAPDVDLTLEDATDLESFVGEFRAAAADTGTEIGRTFRCCFAFAGGPFGHETAVTSDIGVVVTQAERRIAALSGSSQLLEVVAIVVSVAVLAAAGAFAAAARLPEGRLLLARGRGPAILIGKAALEAVVPSAAGAAVGLGTALALLAFLGPGGSIGLPALLDAATATGAAVAASLLVVAVATVATWFLRSDVHPRRLGALARVPWELLAIGFSAFAFAELRTDLVGGLPTLGAGPPSPYLFLLPIAVIGGAAALGARGFRLGARWLRGRTGRLRPWSYLAVHRLADASGLSMILFVAAGLSLGIFVQGQTIVASLHRTVDAKARVFVGSDVEGWVPEEAAVPPGFPFPATRVTSIPEVGTADPHGTSFDLLALDPATFTDAAFWSDAFAGPTFEELVGRLADPAVGPIPVIVVSENGLAVTALQMHQRTVPVSVAGRASAFPGMVSRRPLVVVDAARLESAYEGVPGPLDNPDARPEIWVRGEAAAATEALYGLDLPPFLVLTVDEVKDIPYIAAVIDMFTVLNVLGLAAALLVVAALMTYLQARQRSQIVAYGLSKRMGMGPGQHRRSLAVEVGSILGSSFALGLGVGVLVVAVLLPLLDPLSSVPPEPLLTLPVAIVAVTSVGLFAASWGAARLTGSRAEATRLGEVLRVDE